jgi:hypothetical protein
MAFEGCCLGSPYLGRLLKPVIDGDDACRGWAGSLSDAVRHETAQVGCSMARLKAQSATSGCGPYRRPLALLMLGGGQPIVGAFAQPRSAT